MSAMGDFAFQLGLASQIKDDIFDYEEKPADIGKPVGIDLLEQKITQPLLCALACADAGEQARIRGMVRNIPDHPEYVEEIRAFVKAQKGAEKAAEVMDNHVEKAISCLEVLPESKEKLYLARLARFVGQRNK